jgi:LDH2 family malate/lactate/ureidoglycolate dehydrogenase
LYIIIPVCSRKGYDRLQMTNASPLVAPTHSKERTGTNPIAPLFPAGEENDFS